MIDVILSQGKQLKYNYEFHPFYLGIAHFGGRGGVWKRLLDGFGHFPKGYATKNGPNQKLYFWEKSTFLSNTFSMASVGLEKKSITRRGSSISLENKKCLFRKDFSSGNSFRFIWSCHFFFTPLVDCSHCFGSQTVIVSVLQLLFVFLCPLWHWPRWKLVVIVFFGTAKRTARLISQWVCGKTRKVGLLTTFL